MAVEYFFNRVLPGLLCAAVLAACTDTKDQLSEQAASYASAADLGSFCDRLPRPAYAALQKHTTSNDWFEVYEVGPGIFAIYEPFQWQEVISYLIVGTDSAVLFDTGNGIGDIKAIVDQLTGKPIRVINSHSHFDHIGGNYQFDEIWSIATDFTLARTGGIQTDEIRMEASPEALCKGLPEGVSQAEHQTRPFTITKRIAEGDVVDIGGRQLEVLHLPGHTDDSIALLDREAGFLWSGDSFYAGPIWLFFPETDLAAYRESVAKLAALAPKLRAVFPAHNTPKANPALLLALRDSLDRVLAGKVDPVPVGDGNVEFRFAGFSFLMRENYHSLAADDNVVNVYNWADYIGPNTLQQFEAEYGIKVNYDTYPSSEVLDAKLLIGNTGYDVVVHSNSFATRFAPIGIYEKLDMSRLSNLKNLDPTIMSRLDIYAAVNGYNIPYHWGTTGYTWNAEMVHARIPDYPGTNGDMIFDPDIVARLADCGVTLLDSPTDLFPMVMAYLGRDPSVLDEDSVAAAVTQLDLVRPYIRYFSNEKIVSDMATGELCVAQSWSGTYGQALRRTREAGIDINLRYTVPAEGSGVWVDGLYILSDAKHKDNAYLFLDFMLRPEIAAEVANMVYYANANSASWPLLDPEMFANPAVFPDDETWARLFASLPPNPKQERYMTRAFSRLKSGL